MFSEKRGGQQVLPHQECIPNRRIDGSYIPLGSSQPLLNDFYLVQAAFNGERIGVIIDVVKP